MDFFMKDCRRLRDLFSFPGFVARARLAPVEHDSKARIVILQRQKKRRCVRTVGIVAAAVTISVFTVRVTCAWRGGACLWNLSAGECVVQDARACM